MLTQTNLSLTIWEQQKEDVTGKIGRIFELIYQNEDTKGQLMYLKKS